MAKRNPTRAEADDLAIIAHMRDMPLKAGQMLILGPKSVEILRTGKFAGVLPDRFIYDKAGWQPTQQDIAEMHKREAGNATIK